jgi:pre-mRNA-splicing factor CDC5/CEF1
MEQADELIKREMIVLLEHDNAKYPLEGKKKMNKSAANGITHTDVPELGDFEDQELREVSYKIILS